MHIDSVRASGAPILPGTPAERALPLKLFGFSEALQHVVIDPRPNLLIGCLFHLASRYSTLFDHCPVLRADIEQLRGGALYLAPRQR